PISANREIEKQKAEDITERHTADIAEKDARRRPVPHQKTDRRPSHSRSELPQRRIATGPESREQQQTSADGRRLAASQAVDPVHEVEKIDPPQPDDTDRGEPERTRFLGQNSEADCYGGRLRQQSCQRRKAAQIVDPS